MTCLCGLLAYTVYMNHTSVLYNSWGSADWAITYAGGFVRRGLSGEIALALANTFSMNIVHAIALIKTIIYCTLASSILYIIHIKKINFMEALYFFLPWGFSFYITDVDGTGKKELLFLSFFFIYIAMDLSKQISLRYKFIYLFLSCNFMLLMHEAQFFFLQFFVLYEILRDKMSKLNVLKLYVPLYMLVTCCFIMLFIFKGDSSHVNAIWSQLAQYNLPSEWITYGSIGSLDYKHIFKLKMIHVSNYTLSISFLFIALFFYSYLVTKKTNAIYLLLSFCISAPLYIVAMDWGRWIHVFFISSFLCIYSTRTLRCSSFLQINRKTLPCIMLSIFCIAISLKIIPLFHTYPNQPSNRLYQIYEILHGLLL